MRAFVRPLLLMSIVLLIPILPFVFFGAELDRWFAAWSDRTTSPLVIAAVIVGLLATDILLPVPSSVVSTFGGGALGAWGGTLASWVGMSVGAGVGFALARWLGPPFALRFSSAQELDRMRVASARFGPLILIVARGIPVLAEASVLLLGIHRLAWKRFLPAVIASNFGIALAYSALGTFAARHQWLPLAIGISVALPLVLTTLARWWMPARVAGRRDTSEEAWRGCDE